MSIEIQKHRLTVFTGVSGSGKSSLVFGTIAAESQRLINETYSRARSRRGMARPTGFKRADAIYIRIPIEGAGEWLTTLAESV